ncbi:Hpt domain-containing protein [Larkinella arboricola]
MTICSCSTHYSTDNLLNKLDYNRLLQLYADDTDTLATHIELFLNDVMPQFQDLEERVQQLDWTGVTSLTHQLRPWLAMVGLTDLENKLWEIEKEAHNRPAFESLQARWISFRAKLQQMTLVLGDELQRIK